METITTESNFIIQWKHKDLQPEEYGWRDYATTKGEKAAKQVIKELREEASHLELRVIKQTVTYELLDW